MALISNLVTVAVVDSAPAYVSSLAQPAVGGPFPVRALSGTYTPTNGHGTTMQAAQTQYDASNPGSVSGVLAFSGGFKAVTGTHLRAHGGGHGDSSNNAIFDFDVSGTTAPVGWTVRQQTTSANLIPDSVAQADGRPVACHTYDSLFYDGVTNRCYRVASGVMWPTPNGNPGGWAYDASGNESDNLASRWNHYSTTNPTGGTAPTTMYDPVTGKMLGTDPTGNVGGTTGVWFFRPSTNTWSASAGTITALTNYGKSAYDTTRLRGVYHSSVGAVIIPINFVNETIGTPTTSALSLPNSSTAMVYDSVQDCFWALGYDSNGSSTQWTTIYQINASTFAVTPRTLTGDPIQSATYGADGPYGRWLFRSDWRAWFICSSSSSPIYVIRLP